jgi:hypothetical protein
MLPWEVFVQKLLCNIHIDLCNVMVGDMLNQFIDNQAIGLAQLVCLSIVNI